MSHAQNQHWLPQFYLRRFAVPGWRNKKNAKIWVVDSETGELAERKIREVAATNFLYSHIKDDGTRCFRVEKKLAELETMIASLYPRIAEGYPDLSAAWGIKKLTALFIATLILRHPDAEVDTREMHKRMVAFYERLPKDAEGRPAVSHIFEGGKAHELDTSDYEEYKAADENRLKQMFAEQIQPSAVKMTDILFAKRWAFLCTDRPIFFTSDKPVMKQHAQLRNFGIRTAGVHLWFPVSPTRILWMSDRAADQPDGFYPLPLSEAASLNAMTMGHATRFLLSDEHPDTRMLNADIVTQEMMREYGPPRPLEGAIWKSRT
ncbi:MAG: DUF4238 domain-containing protein [Chthoniobacter sp.]|nr:DUF4238 domain-containing protein [Chthoniobacter sp.]